MVHFFFFFGFGRKKIILHLFFMFICQNVGNLKGFLLICDRLWENRPLRAQYDFSVEAFVDYLTRKK